jgi:hypothetical protein
MLVVTAIMYLLGTGALVHCLALQHISWQTHLQSSITCVTTSCDLLAKHFGLSLLVM